MRRVARALPPGSTSRKRRARLDVLLRDGRRIARRAVRGRHPARPARRGREGSRPRKPQRHRRVDRLALHRLRPHAPARVGGRRAEHARTVPARGPRGRPRERRRPASPDGRTDPRGRLAHGRRLRPLPARAGSARLRAPARARPEEWLARGGGTRRPSVRTSSLRSSRRRRRSSASSKRGAETARGRGSSSTRPSRATRALPRCAPPRSGGARPAPAATGLPCRRSRFPPCRSPTSCSRKREIASSEKGRSLRKRRARGRPPPLRLSRLASRKGGFS